MEKLILPGFKPHVPVDDALLRQYRSLLPAQLVEHWENFGFGTAAQGYFKVINPLDYQFLLYSEQDQQTFHVIFATAMCDLILWNSIVKKVMMLNCRKGVTKTIASDFDSFILNMNRNPYRDRTLDWLPYPLALGLLGEPDYDECYCYVPILKVGGNEAPENLKIGSLLEHIKVCMDFILH